MVPEYLWCLKNNVHIHPTFMSPLVPQFDITASLGCILHILLTHLKVIKKL